MKPITFLQRAQSSWRALLALLLIAALPGTVAASTAPAIDRNDITVWTYPAPGSPLHEFKAVTRVRSSLSGLIALLMDTGAADQWIYRTRRMQLLSRDDAAQTFTLHVVTNFWPLKDRDVVVSGTLQQDPASLLVVVTSTSTEDARAPANPAYVRMPEMNGRWEFRPLGKGEVEVTMYGRADPGGRLPHFLVNLFTSEVPYQTLAGLRRRIGHYQQARLEGLQEAAD